MSEWLNNQKNSNSNFRQFLKKRIEKANPRRQLNAEETKHLNKLEAIQQQMVEAKKIRNTILF